jgi:hypothetical protein
MLPPISNTCTVSKYLSKTQRLKLTAPIKRVNNTSYQGADHEKTRMRLLNHNKYSINRDYYIDFSDDFLDRTETLRIDFEAGKYKSIHIFGNSPGLTKVPEYIFKDDNILKIGLNRAFIHGQCDILMWTDNTTIQSIRKRLTEPDLSKTIIVKVGGEHGIDIAGYRRTNYRDFVGYYIEKISVGNEKLFESWPHPSLIMVKTVLSSALHFVWKVLYNCRDIPIILDGVSMDNRNYFYDKSVNPRGHKPNKPYVLGNNSGKSCSTFKVITDCRKLSHTSIITDILQHLVEDGYNISYTDDSKMLDAIDGLNQIEY